MNENTRRLTIKLATGRMEYGQRYCCEERLKIAREVNDFTFAEEGRPYCIFRYYENWYLHFELKGWRCFVLLRRNLNQLKILLKKTFSTAHGNFTLNIDRPFFVDAKHAGNVVAIELEIGEQSQFADALQRKNRNEQYGSELLQSVWLSIVVG